MLFTGEFGGAGIYRSDDEEQAGENENDEEKLGCREARLWIMDDLGDQWLEQSAGHTGGNCSRRVGRVCDEWKGMFVRCGRLRCRRIGSDGVLGGLPIGNRRYGRVPFCVTMGCAPMAVSVYVAK